MKKLLLVSLAFVSSNFAMDQDKSVVEKQKARKYVALAKKAADKGNKDKALKLAKKSTQISPEDNATGNFLVADLSPNPQVKQKYLEQAAMSKQTVSESQSKAKAVQTLNSSNSATLMQSFTTKLSQLLSENKLDEAIAFIDSRKTMFPNSVEFAESVLNLLDKADKTTAVSWIIKNAHLLLPSKGSIQPHDRISLAKKYTGTAINDADLADLVEKYFPTKSSSSDSK